MFRPEFPTRQKPRNLQTVCFILDPSTCAKLRTLPLCPVLKTEQQEHSLEKLKAVKAPVTGLPEQ